VGSQEGSAQDGVIPIEDNASLVNFGLVCGLQPNLVVCQARHQLVTNLFVRFGVGANVSVVSAQVSLVVYRREASYQNLVTRSCTLSHCWNFSVS